MPYKLFKISNGADGIFIENTRFNTTVISFNFYLPLKEETIAENALLPFILTTCSKEFPDYSKLNLKLNMLYGADLSVSVDKVRDVQHIRIAISAINDEFSFSKKESVLSDAMELLLSIVFNPLTNNYSFSELDTEREKRKQLEHISGEFNDKRVFAKNRMLNTMFKNSAYGISKYGTKEFAEKIIPQDMYRAWKNMLSTSYLRVQVIGKTLPDGIFDKVALKLSDFYRNEITDYAACQPVLSADNITRVTDNYDIAQGKLVMGFSSELSGEDAFSLNVMCDIFGGGPYSLLFENVREKMSLCYYCSASVVRTKGLIVVQSGVDAKNCEKAEEEILNQLELIKQGKFSDFAFNASKKSIISSLNSYNDSVYGLDKWYSSAILKDDLITPELVVEKINLVTKEDVIAAAKGIKLHTVYKLLPKGDC